MFTGALPKLFHTDGHWPRGLLKFPFPSSNPLHVSATLVYLNVFKFLCGMLHCTAVPDGGRAGITQQEGSIRAGAQATAGLTGHADETARSAEVTGRGTGVATEVTGRDLFLYRTGDDECALFPRCTGSHDSFSFWVDEKAPVGPDQKPVVKHLAVVFRLLAKKVMKKWSMTQTLTFKEQLEGGIRYFDLRVSSKPGEPGYEVYFIHGLFGHRVRDGLNEINTFLNSHPKEVVFLDFNHHYAMSIEHHMYLITMLQQIFGNKLCKCYSVEDITLDYLWENKYQVIVFYHHPLSEEHSHLWPGSNIPAPWANTTDAFKLIQFLETTLGERAKYGSFHVSQAILTPRVKTIARGLIKGLRNHLVERNLPTIMTWVEAQRPGVNGVNIITCDFVELVDFANIVINLNKLLLPNHAIT